MSDALFGGVLARGEAAEAVSDRAFLQAMIDVELALARSLASAGLAPPEAAEELAAIADAARLDLAELNGATAEYGTPVPGLLRALRERMTEAGAAHLHHGATSQDIVDTATMLVARRALEPLLKDIGGAADACALLAERHRDTVMPGRTLLQQGAPVTFGLKAAGWLTALDMCEDDLLKTKNALPLQLGGAVGTLASLGDRGLDVAAGVAERLELTLPVMPWHAQRVVPARLASALATATGAMAKIARDVTLLAQTEVSELREGGDDARGGSSAMPQKRNPVGAIAVLTCAQRVPALAAAVHAAMAQEQERGTGGWQSEPGTLAELLRLTGSAAAALRDLLGRLEIDPARMRLDIDPLSLSESVALTLAERIGQRDAADVVRAAALRSSAEGVSFREALLGIPEVRERIGVELLDAALDPTRHLGVTHELIDRALRAHNTPKETR